jgi:hypothetical protein
MITGCTHLDRVKTNHRNTNGCKECLRTGDTWVHLRVCRTCGHVGCCDDSKNRHARKHFHATSHPIVTSIEPGESWSWCFVDEVFLKEELLLRYSGGGGSAAETVKMDSHFAGNDD